SQVDYVKNPSATNDLLVTLDKEYKGFGYSKEQADFSVQQQLALKIVSNGPNGTLGDFDVDRAKQVISIVAPMYQSQHKDIKAGLTEQDLVTNEFIDQSIGLG